MRFTRWALLALAAVLAVAGCGIGEKRTGTIRFDLGNRIMFSIMPGTSLVLEHYEVDGVGTSGQALGNTFNDVIIGSDGTGEVEALPGDWTLTVTAWNDDTPSVAVGQGVTSVSVVVGVPVTATLSIFPFTGLGDFSTTLSWVPDVITNAQVELDLVEPLSPYTTHPITVTQPVDYPAGEFTAEEMDGDGEGDIPLSCIRVGSASLEAGWYTGFLRVKDAGVLNAGIVRAVRVMYNAETHWREHLTVAQLSGFIGLEFEWYPGLPLIVTSDHPYLIDVYEGGNVTVTAACGNNDPATTVSYRWFLNGESTPVSTSASYTIVASAFEIDSMNYLSCIVTQSDGKRLGDFQHKVNRLALDPEMVEADGQLNSGSFSYGTPCIVSLYLSPDWTTPVATQSIVNGGFFSFPGLAAGVYGLKADFGFGSGSDWSWWNSAQGKVQGGAPGEVITIPSDGLSDYDFLGLLGG